MKRDSQSLFPQKLLFAPRVHSSRFSTRMALFKYFAPSSSSKLPPPDGPLSKEVPSSTISLINDEVKKVLVDNENPSTCVKKQPKHYSKFAPDVKAMLGKYAAEHGVAATLRKFAKTHPGMKESTVRVWRDV